jgi:hypothetical protein
MKSLLMASKESVLDRRYRVVIYAMLHFVRVAIVGLIITVGSIQIEFFTRWCNNPANQVCGMGPLLSAACLSGGRDKTSPFLDFTYPRVDYPIRPK